MLDSAIPPPPPLIPPPTSLASAWRGPHAPAPVMPPAAPLPPAAPVAPVPVTYWGRKVTQLCHLAKGSAFIVMSALLIVTAVVGVIASVACACFAIANFAAGNVAGGMLLGSVSLFIGPFMVINGAVAGIAYAIWAVGQFKAFANS